MKGPGGIVLMVPGHFLKLYFMANRIFSFVLLFIGLFNVLTALVMRITGQDGSGQIADSGIIITALALIISKQNEK